MLSLVIQNAVINEFEYTKFRWSTPSSAFTQHSDWSKFLHFIAPKRTANNFFIYVAVMFWQTHTNIPPIQSIFMKSFSLFFFVCLVCSLVLIHFFLCPLILLYQYFMHLRILRENTISIPNINIRTWHALKTYFPTIFFRQHLLVVPKHFNRIQLMILICFLYFFLFFCTCCPVIKKIVILPK